MRPLLPGLVMAVLIASAPAVAADPAEVIAAERAFAATAQKKGIAAAFRAWAAPEAIAFAPDPVPAHTTFADAPGATLKWWPIHAGLAASGDLGFTTGPFVLTREGRTMHGHYFTIWKRQPDGSWRWLLDHGPPMREASPFGPHTPVSTLAAAAPLPTAAPGAAWGDLLAAEAALAEGLAADAPAAYVAVLAEEARLMRPGPQPAVGRTAVADLLAAGPARIRARHLGGGVSEAGDLAWSDGDAAWETEGNARRGHYVRVWQRRPQGWRIVFDEIIPVPPSPPKAL